MGIEPLNTESRSIQFVKGGWEKNTGEELNAGAFSSATTSTGHPGVIKPDRNGNYRRGGSFLYVLLESDTSSAVMALYVCKRTNDDKKAFQLSKMDR